MPALLLVSFGPKSTRGNEMPGVPRTKEVEKTGPLSSVFWSALGTSGACLCPREYRSRKRTLRKKDFFPREELKNIRDISENFH